MLKVISKGTIAISERDHKGLITEERAVPMKDIKGNMLLVWKGYCLAPSKIGRPWYSVNPKFIQQTTEKQYDVMLSMIEKFNIKRQVDNKCPLK